MRILNPDALRWESYANVPLKEATCALKVNAPTESTHKREAGPVGRMRRPESIRVLHASNNQCGVDRG